MRTVALFDLDGTITRADTMLEFLAMALGRSRTWFLLASVFPLWVLAKLKVLDADAPKKALMRKAFRGKKAAPLEQCAERFASNAMPELLRPAAMECIRQHLRNGHKVLVVTASCSLWAGPWCRQEGIELIATGLERREGTFTGRLATPNCRGEEKVRRIREHLGMSGQQQLVAYGDTPGDLPMLAMADEAHYKPFRGPWQSGRNSPPKAFAPAAFPWVLAASALVLALCAYLAFRIARHPVPASAMVGEYHRARSLFLPVAGLPERMELRADGSMELRSGNGEIMFEGPWKWDARERLIRTDAPRWDRQFRLRSTLGGPRLCLRVCPLSFANDEPEHDEEVDWLKGPGPTQPKAP